MKKALSIVIALALTCSMLLTQPVFSASDGERELVYSDERLFPATFHSGFGDIEPVLKKGFDFIQTDSSVINWDLALAGAVLSQQVYVGNSAEGLLQELGYDVAENTTPSDSEKNVAFHPVSCIGYKRISGEDANDKNIFAVIVRGTEDFMGEDGKTDLIDGAQTMFDVSRGNVVDDIKSFITDKTGKSIEELEREDNYFFLAGHSLGGAVANALSVDATVTSLCGGNKGHIYTYTYEPPHTCVNLWWMNVEEMANAFNFKDVDDAVTNLAPYIGATTYGKDMSFSVNDLDNSIFVEVFPNAKGGSVTEAPRPVNHGDIWGHHDIGLDLIYIIQHGISAGWWDQVYALDGIVSMWPVWYAEEPEAQETAGADFLLGEWSTSDGVELTFDETTYLMDWGYFFSEKGSWNAEPVTEDALRIELEGSNILSIMSLIYGSTSSNYHFEVLKCNDDNFYLVQVYGDYTAKTSPCKLGFTRKGAAADFHYDSRPAAKDRACARHRPGPRIL